MKIQKPFDPKALFQALEAKGLPDAEAAANDLIPVIFDWINSSIGMESGVYGPILQPIVTGLEQKAMDGLKAAEAEVEAEVKADEQPQS